MVKPPLFLLAFAVVALTAAAIADEPSTEGIRLKYVSASDLYDAIKQEFGLSVIALTTPMDLRENSLKINPADPQAKKVRELIAEVDRPDPRRP